MVTAEVGQFSVVVAWLCAVIGALAGLVAQRNRSRSWLLSTRNATILVCVFTVISAICLALLFASDDYSNQYVWSFSNRSMPWYYKVSAIWGGMDGSMLLWCTLLSISALLVAVKIDWYPAPLRPIALSALNVSSIFFLSIVVFLTNPFRFISADFIPPDGNGLNPLLQNPYMAIHPPMLYLGFTTFTVPYAFCIAALASGYLGNEWIRATRTWTLVAWAFLTTGIALGGHWAYLELGWGGFWAWDPVENASFLPWLTATAYLHSVMVQERKGMLKSWNIWLVVLTYGLTVFGTFLTRSGVVQSVHAFASTDIGWTFLLYLFLLVATVFILTYIRRKELAPERSIESFFSRESAFLVNNLLFLSICFAVLWGVMFPVLSEWATGEKRTVSIPFFNAVNIPLFLMLIFLMGVGPLLAWRKASWPSMYRSFVLPFAIASVAAVALILSGITSFYPVLSYSLCVFVLLTILIEFHRTVRVNRKGTERTLAQAAVTVLTRHRTRYGGYLVHFGVLVAVVGITASMAHKLEEEFTLAPGQTVQFRRFNLKLNDVSQVKDSNYDAVKANVSLSRASDKVELEVMQPELRFYHRKSENTTEVALRMGPLEDVYLVVAGLSQDGGRVSFKLFINPLQIWLWIGVIIMVVGTLLVLTPRSFRPQGS